MDINNDLMSRIIEYICRYDENCLFGNDCNYGDFIIVADWNNKKLDKLGSWLAFKKFNDADISNGFDDEYVFCSDCYGLIYTTPTFYCDTGRYIYLENDILCKKCIMENREEVIEYCMNKTNVAILDYLTTYAKYLGFSCFSNDDNYCPIYETGFHIGQNDNPKDIVKK